MSNPLPCPDSHSRSELLDAKRRRFFAALLDLCRKHKVTAIYVHPEVAGMCFTFNTGHDFPPVFRREDIRKIDFEDGTIFGSPHEPLYPPEIDFFQDLIFLGEKHDVATMSGRGDGGTAEMTIKFLDRPKLSGVISICPACINDFVFDGMAMDLSPVPDNYTPSGNDDCFA